jgi:hypothetical protein
MRQTRLAPETLVHPSVSQPSRGRFYRGIGIATIAVAVVAFTPGIVHPAGRNAPISALVWIHAAVFFSWLLLYVLQAALIAEGHVRLHRRLGAAAALLALAVLVTGYATAITMGRRGIDLGGDLRAELDPLGALVFPLGDLLSFAVLVAAAYAFRRHAAVHKRLMVLATAGSLMAAPWVHLLAKFAALRDTPAVILIPLTGMYMACAVHDRVVHGRVHVVSLWGGLLLLAWAQLRAGVIGPSAVWHQVAAWLVR